MTAEHPGTPGAAWERELLRMAEVVVPEDDGAPLGWDEPAPGEYRPNRRTRRATRRATGRARPQTDTDTHNPGNGPQTGTQGRDDKENH